MVAAGPARPQALGPEDIALGGQPDVVAWWGDPARPGARPEPWLGTGTPWTLAGLALGAWSVATPGRAPLAVPWPAVPVTSPPLAWVDTLELRSGSAAWAGWGAGLLDLVGSSRAASSRTRTMLTVGGGSPGLEDYGLRVERGTLASGLAASVATSAHGASGALENGARHQWGLDGRLTRGDHRLEASFAQRGSAEELHAGEGEAASGESGDVSWTWSARGRRLSLGFARGRESRESFGDTLPLSRREAGESRGAAEVGWTRGRMAWDTRAEFRTAHVRRRFAGASDRRADAVWLASRVRLPLARGTLEASLGGGRHETLGGVDFAPSVAWRDDSSAVRKEVVFQRALVPVWSDLDPASAPFLQSTWMTRASLGVDAPVRTTVSLLAGRSDDPAAVRRLPLVDWWLREGVRHAGGARDFLVGHARLEASPRPLLLSAEGYGVARSTKAGSVAPGVVPPNVRTEPSWATRIEMQAEFRAFQGDLRGRFGPNLALVGPRETDEPTPRRLGAYATFGLAASVRLADATFALQVRNLEGRVRPEVWIDPATGLPAAGPGREIRFGLTWPLVN